ncbi:SMC-Scp complex subunit ScpB [Apilactobacillus sp. TMW 2.2459]|uniref:SMC-Scp complex subunit ScpB n=1 Tax=Apilactobacillus xinyiensis TaxID=2841032 RepID=UPI00200ECFFE|nr:SMC-Scp complex subunit ScpB [Apilactobacillus xinyiensis]MCL0311672.1 SMC-Scp complex subunit ScpB [Apilactobacillus xinyiensis]
MISNKGKIEALIYASGNQGISLAQIIDLIKIDTNQIKLIIDDLNDDLLHNQDSGLLILNSANKYRFATKPCVNNLITDLVGKDSIKLSQSNLETLTIIAYEQPITRIEIDEIRGVNSSRTIQKLLDLNLILKNGKKDALGNPTLYATTQKFLEVFGLNSLKDLPNTNIKEK